MVGGSVSQHLVGFAAPLAMGAVIRSGRSLTALAALKLIAIHIVVAIGFGDVAWAALQGLAMNLALIAGGALAFRRLRSAGFITSQIRVGAAVGLASACGALAWTGVDHLLFSSPSLGTAVSHWIAATVGSALAIGVVLTPDRVEETWVSEFIDREPRPSMLEHAAATLLLGLLVVGSIGDGRPEMALAASVALMWFALRLGLFATSLAACAFSAAMLTFASNGLWPVFLATSDPVEAEALRYLALALLAAPSVVTAAAMHDQKRERRAFAYRAMHDGLTRLANRSLFLETMEAASAASAYGQRFALFLIDLDHFKSVNDGFGHMRGDRLLVEVASRLKGSMRATDLVARIGGDEFAVVAPVRTAEDAMKLAKRLVESVHLPVDLDGVEVMPSITLGGVLSPESAADPQRMILLADESLYAAKAAGRNCWRFSSAGHEAETVPIWSPAEAQAASETIYLD